MAYHVVYSKHPYLLARLCTDLQMEGMVVRHEQWHPFDAETPPMNRLFVGDTEGFVSFGNHEGVGNPARWHLTEKSYPIVLENIIND